MSFWYARWYRRGAAPRCGAALTRLLRLPRSARRGGRPGQALVEFALVITILGVLITGVVDFGRAFYYDVMVAGAALEGARAAAEGADDTDRTANGVTMLGVTSRVRNTAGPGLGPQLTVSVTPPPAVRGSPSGVGLCTPSTCIWTTVTVSYTFTKFTPWMRALTGPTTTMTRRVTQRMRIPCATPNGTACT